MKFNPIDLARLFLFVREAKDPNTGLRVEAIIKWCGGRAGESWCCYFVTMILDICFGGNSPIPRTGSCQQVYDLCKAKGWLTGTPNFGDLFFYIDANGHVHHIGFVAEIQKLAGIAGNTSPDGKSTNGDGVYEHPLYTRVFAAYPRQ